jgi:hypothetical protein
MAGRFASMRMTYWAGQRHTNRVNVKVFHKAVMPEMPKNRLEAIHGIFGISGIGMSI